MLVVFLKQSEKFDWQQYWHGSGAMNSTTIADLFVYGYSPPFRRLMMYQRQTKCSIIFRLVGCIRLGNNSVHNEGLITRFVL